MVRCSPAFVFRRTDLLGFSIGDLNLKILLVRLERARASYVHPSTPVVVILICDPWLHRSWDRNFKVIGLWAKVVNLEAVNCGSLSHATYFRWCTWTAPYLWWIIWIIYMIGRYITFKDLYIKYSVSKGGRDRASGAAAILGVRRKLPRFNLDQTGHLFLSLDLYRGIRIRWITIRAPRSSRGKPRDQRSRSQIWDWSPHARQIKVLYTHPHLSRMM